MISYEEALAELVRQRPSVAKEVLPLGETLGRVLAVDLRAPISSPPFTNSAMDGYAFVHSDVRSGMPLDVLGDVFAQANATDASLTYTKGACVRIMTGGVVPIWADTVIAVESTEIAGNRVIFSNLPDKGSNIRYAGEDAKEGQLVMDAGMRLNPEKIMVAAAFGFKELEVLVAPKVAVISTGDELKLPGEPLPPGAIYNSSRFFLEASLAKIGLPAAAALSLGDDSVEARAQIESFLVSLDSGPGLLITTGAVSAGSKDFLPALAQALGFAEVFHKVAIRPGKPVYFAKKNDVYWIGLPGNAVSTCVGWHFFVRPLLAAIAGIPEEAKRTVKLKNAVNKPEALRCFYRAEINGKKAWVPEAQGSARLMASVTAEAYVILPEGRGRVPADTELTAIEI